MFKVFSFLLIILSIVACIPKSSSSNLGFLHADRGTGRELYRPEFPVKVCPLDHDEFFDLGAMWWNRSMERDGKARQVLALSCSPGTLVFAQFADVDADSIGLTRYRYTRINGFLRDTNVFIDPGMTPDLTLWVVIHELGHVLGFADDKNDVVESSIMSAKIVRTPQLTYQDWKLLADHYDTLASMDETW